jgi:hypothetical protein
MLLEMPGKTPVLTTAVTACGHRLFLQIQGLLHIGGIVCHVDVIHPLINAGLEHLAIAIAEGASGVNHQITVGDRCPQRSPHPPHPETDRFGEGLSAAQVESIAFLPG